jgi:hypothetical protein
LNVRLGCFVALLLTLVGSAGCSFLLPRGERRVEVKWNSFREAKAAYDAVELGRTRSRDLLGLGFGPTQDANVQDLDYLELIRKLVPIGPLRGEDLPDALQECVAARDRCRGVTVDVSQRKRKRIGFWLLDLLAFRRQEHTSGWDFGSTLVLVDGTVVYKTWHGTPEIDEYDDDIRPLGLFQDPGSLLVRIFLP